MNQMFQSSSSTILNCRKCNQDKPENHFYTNGNGKKRNHCIECHNKVSKEAANKRKKHTAERARVYELKEKYGLSVTDYNILLLNQNGCCKICENHQRTFNTPLVVDHCHSTGVVRGLLCDYCNKGLGFFKDSYVTLLAAASYIKVDYDQSRTPNS